MDFLGIGISEILVIILVPIVVLGPSKTLGLSKTVGRAIGEVRRAFLDFSDAIENEHKDIDILGEYRYPNESKSPGDEK